jgi:hypothetical protein
MLAAAGVVCHRVYQFLFPYAYPQTATTFGLPYDSTRPLAKARMFTLSPFWKDNSTTLDWTLLSASSVFNATSSVGRDALISMVHSRSFWQSGTGPNPASYSPVDGKQTAGFASPAMGAVYSFLALKYVPFPPFFST